MKKNILNLFVLAVLTLTVSCKGDKSEAKEAEEVAVASEDSTPYVVDSNTSIIEWTGSKPAGKHNGTVTVSAGEIYMKDGAVESGLFTLDMNSITVLDLQAGDGKEDLEAHLKGTVEDQRDDFFNVSKYPEGKFEITSVTTVNGQTTINGNLTLKEVTKNVSFPATIAIDEDTINIMSETFMINRTDWGINFMSKSFFDNLKDKFINDEIQIKVSVKAAR